jgi:heme exporter protein B
MLYSALLGFPIVIPVLIFITRISNEAITSSAMSAAAFKNILLLGSINIVLIAFAYILFPYLWRD